MGQGRSKHNFRQPVAMLQLDQIRSKIKSSYLSYTVVTRYSLSCVYPSTMSTEPSVISLSLTPDARALLWLSADGTLRLWDSARLCTASILPNARLLCAANRFVALADPNSPSVRFVSLPDLHLLPYISRSPFHEGIVLALTTPHGEPGSPHGLYAVGVAEGIVVRSYGGEDLITLNTSSAPLCAAFDSEGKKFCAGDARGRVLVWHLTEGWSGSVERAHKSFVSCVSFCKDGGLLSGGWDGYARVWEAAKKMKKRVEVRAEKGKVLAVAGGEDAFVTGGLEGVVKVWNFKGGKVAEHSAHGKSVHALAFSNDGRHVVSGGSDGSVRLFGVPTKPVLFSNEEGGDGGSFASMGVILKGQRSDRQLVFCPSGAVTLSCPICGELYDADRKKPIVSGACGHTFACSLCNGRLWETDKTPRCPVCRVALLDIAPNYELLRVLTTAKEEERETHHATNLSTTPTSQSEGYNADYIALDRLYWLDAPELAYLTRHNCTIFNGKMDGEVVAIRLPYPTLTSQSTSATGSHLDETERHLQCLKRLRGPHVTQLYGVSRTCAPDNRILVISDLPAGGTLANNISLLRSQHHFISQEGILSLSLQLVRALRFLHASNTSAGWALSPDTIALSDPLSKDWSVQQRIKFMELSGTISRSECSIDVQRDYPADFVGYMAPELLDEDRSMVKGRDDLFERFCQADLYTLGVVLWEIMTMRKAFEGTRPVQVVAAVVGRQERPGIVPVAMAMEVGELIERLWKTNPEERGSAEEACQMLEMVPSAPPI